MVQRIKDKIEEIGEYLEQLEEMSPPNLGDYIKDFKTKSACERHAEIIIEAVTDLAFLCIRHKELDMPESDLEAFDILEKNKIISSELAKKLKDAKRMRNILAHEYGKINDKIVFNSIKGELIKDVNEFVKKIEKELLG